MTHILWLIVTHPIFRITSETSDNGIVEIRVKALYDYKAKEEDEIDLKKGQILTQMKPGDDQGKWKNRQFYLKWFENSVMEIGKGV